MRKKFFKKGKFKKRFLKNVQNRQHVSMRRLLPHIVTIIALSLGMTAMRFAFLHEWREAVLCILFAAVLDGMDGRLARFLGSDSLFGAELDSISDFLCFGVAPALILYEFVMYRWHSVGWGICLFFAVCMALRLARFNIAHLSPSKGVLDNRFFTGVPSPMGAVLVLVPLFLFLGGCLKMRSFPTFTAILLVFNGLLLISRLPTFSIKNMRLPPKKTFVVLVFVTLLLSQAFFMPWLVLTFVAAIYFLSLPIGLWYIKRHSQKKHS